MKRKIFVLMGFILGMFSMLSLSLLSSPVLAQGVDFAILPEAENTDKVVADVIDISTDDGTSVWDRYKKNTAEKRSLGDRLASGVLTWDSLLDYVVYLVKFLSQLGLFIGAAAIIYAGYMYATDIMGGDANNGTQALKYAIIGIVVISFSYAIIKILTNMFIE